MQFLQGRSIQQEFCHLLNALIDSARQVIVAADRPAYELEALDQRVRSRLAGGVSIEMASPDLDMRRTILNTRVSAELAIACRRCVLPRPTDAWMKSGLNRTEWGPFSAMERAAASATRLLGPSTKPEKT